jgi:hypothetical protein
MSALDQQVGGTHYKGGAIQPIQFIVSNKLPFIEGNIIKYVARWRSKGGVEDLKKARHYVDMLIELEGNASTEAPCDHVMTVWTLETEGYRCSVCKQLVK